jgi:subtilisin family serine protease
MTGTSSLLPQCTRQPYGEVLDMEGSMIVRGSGVCLLLASSALAERPAIRSPADLPATRFQLATPPSESLMSRALITNTLPQIRAEAERVRAQYDIQDQALARELRNGLAAIAVLQHRPADARKIIAESRDASTKPQQKAIGMMLLDAAADIVDGPQAARCERGAKRIDALLNEVDPQVIRDDVLQQRTGLEAVGEAFVIGTLKAQTDPGAAADQGRIGLRDGLDLAAWRAQLEIVNACRVALSGAIQRWAADPTHQPKNIWTAREPAPDSLSQAKPVVVAVWDSGIDQTIFPGQLAADPVEPVDGIDNDGDGIVDDWNGPTFDQHMQPDPSPLKRASPTLADQLAFQAALYKGTTDMQFGLDTAEARLFATRGREAPVADQELDALLWEEMASRSHGTAVASEIADGNGFVRLFSVTAQPWGNDPREVVVDEAMNDRWIAAVGRLAAKFHAARVRVVNMSWGYTVDEVAEKMVRYGGVTDQAQATARARAMWTKADAAMRRLLGACPDILFVNSAGNSNQTDEILSSTPQTTNAPNLLVVGATGTSGLPTSFTTYGASVKLYAWGQAVPLRVPGGMRMRMSGTSMAAPLVTRAAAQMLAANPRLTPTKLIEGLMASATVDQAGMKLLHPAAALEWARHH